MRPKERLESGSNASGEGFVQVEKIRPDQKRTKGFKEIKSPEHEEKIERDREREGWVQPGQ
jgi:hypothetical protein